MSAGEYKVMYLKEGKEAFSLPMTHQDAEWSARKLSRDGYEVVAIVTSEHAQDRMDLAAQGGALAPGAHLLILLNDVARRFQQDYPKVRRESALEAVSLLCTLSLEGEADLQGALLDEVHTPDLPGSGRWREDIRMAIANRRPEGE